MWNPPQGCIQPGMHRQTSAGCGGVGWRYCHWGRRRRGSVSAVLHDGPGVPDAPCFNGIIMAAWRLPLAPGSESYAHTHKHTPKNTPNPSVLLFKPSLHSICNCQCKKYNNRITIPTQIERAVGSMGDPHKIILVTNDRFDLMLLHHLERRPSGSAASFSRTNNPSLQECPRQGDSAPAVRAASLRWIWSWQRRAGDISWFDFIKYIPPVKYDHNEYRD